ncbi:MAG: hypothetical protein PHW54_03380 [Candidatus Omnitrophica bacterium]|nr:hypothetical protein [Candidatus Omnitrophota bacterium]
MKGLKLQFPVILIFTFFVFNFIGCASTSKNDAMSKEQVGLEPQASLKFNDVPVPAGFKFLPEESYTFQSAGVRVGVLKYHGKADIEQVVTFYKDQMPLYNWNLLNAIEYGQRLLNFDREQESCIIDVAGKGNSITIIISLGPKSEIKPRKATKPVK